MSIFVKNPVHSNQCQKVLYLWIGNNCQHCTFLARTQVWPSWLKKKKYSKSQIPIKKSKYFYFFSLFFGKLSDFYFILGFTIQLLSEVLWSPVCYIFLYSKRHCFSISTVPTSRYARKIVPNLLSFTLWLPITMFFNQIVHAKLVMEKVILSY